MAGLADISYITFFWAFLGGLLPALLWLWFWLKEDARRPEPKLLIFAAFIAGALIIPIALFLEQITQTFVPGGTPLIIVWATIEELLKYMGAFIVAFGIVCIDGSKCLDEPVDPAIYLITVALGFAAIENMLFLIGPLAGGDPLSGIIMGDLRFIGATVLHVVASATIGIAMGLSFYKNALVKRIYLLFGIFTAILLHTLFNLSIIKGEGENILIVFGSLWIAAIILLLLFEKVKKI